MPCGRGLRVKPPARGCKELDSGCVRLLQTQLCCHLFNTGTCSVMVETLAQRWQEWVRQAGGICLGAGSQGLSRAEQGPQGGLGSEAHQLCWAHPSTSDERRGGHSTRWQGLLCRTEIDQGRCLLILMDAEKVFNEVEVFIIKTHLSLKLLATRIGEEFL